MIIFDLDGTLRDVSCGDHLIPGDTTKTENWLDWQAYVNENGKPIAHGLLLYRLALTMGTDVVIATSSQYGTAKWLNKFDLPQPSLIVERKRDDNRHPHDYKKAFFSNTKHLIKSWIDDCAEMCDYVELFGITAIRIRQ